MDAGGAVAIFGGTFNPIHFGHLRSARQLLTELPLAELRLVPAGLPPHRDKPDVSAEDRAAMVALAIEEASQGGETRLTIDRRELERDGPSYSVDTLSDLRRELGPERSLVLVMGCDALLALPSWRRWERLPELAHLVVMARPGWALPQEGEVAQFLRERAGNAADLREKPAGCCLVKSLEPQDISATEIRALLQSGGDISDWVPTSVLAYIRAHGLYGSEVGLSQE